jgi:hypothetical protein
MVNLGTAKLAGLIMVTGILAIAGTNLAFAQTATSTPTTPTGTQEYPCAAAPFYGAQAYGYIACTSLSTAQMEGFITVGVVVALSIACGAAGRQFHTMPPI